MSERERMVRRGDDPPDVEAHIRARGRARDDEGYVEPEDEGDAGNDDEPDVELHRLS